MSGGGLGIQAPLVCLVVGQGYKLPWYVGWWVRDTSSPSMSGGGSGIHLLRQNFILDP